MTGTTSVVKLTTEDIPRLRKTWLEKYQDMLGGVPERLPPMREINHRIPLVDETHQYRYHHPKCSDALKPKLLEKVKRYVGAGWWKFQNVPQAAPMMCLPKKDGGLRTVFDCRQRNDNTIHDVSPFPDQEQIRMDVARAKFRSKIDLSDAYEQIRVEPDDVWKTAFSTIYGTMLSYVMQQGDCNAPSTFQRLMTHVFREHIGRFVHAYLDDVFIYSDTIEEHEAHLGQVFECLRRAQLYLKASKCDLYSPRMDCLGHLIDDRGLHASADKMEKVRNWRIPRDYTDVQRFLGLVQYLAQFMPDVTAFTGPLAEITRNGHSFEWKPLHDKCFRMIKTLACKAPILRPIDARIDEPIWVICDASLYGVGAVYGQGKEWHSCRPAGFMSKKFTVAQHAYRVFEMETIAILEALLKWEDKLLGYPIRIVTDHKALEFFKTQSHFNPRQTRWMEYIERFNYRIVYVKGELNKVADCLSRYYATDRDGEDHPYDVFVNADARFDPDGDELPFERAVELRRMETRSFKSKAEAEERRVLAEELHEHEEDPIATVPTEAVESLKERMARVPEFLTVVAEGYEADSTLAKVMASTEEHRLFTVRDQLLYFKNAMGEDVLCVPRVKLGKRVVTEIVIESAHTAIGHFGERKTGEYIRRWYWWPSLGKDVRRYCESCGVCQTTKTSSQKPPGLLHAMPVPTRPWQSIAMDFVGPFPKSRGCDYLWVVICRLTSYVHLVPTTTRVKASDLAWLYVKEIVCLHGVAESIVSDRDAKFTSAFWKELQRLLGTRLLMSTAFHPQTDGATERANRSITQILRAVVRPDQKDWVDQLPMVQFALNSSASSTTGFAPFELTGGYLPSMVRSLPESIMPGVKAFADAALDNLAMAHDAIIDARVHQTYQANKKRRDENVQHGEHKPIERGDLVYLATENLNLPKGRAKKLLPKFIGPYKVEEAWPDTSTYKIELPEDLRKRRIHPTFHISRLRRHEASDDVLFPHRDTRVFYDMGTPSNDDWLVEEVTGHRGKGKSLEFNVRWNMGDDTWEPLAKVQGCGELELYLETQGVRKVSQLPKL